jgi:phosphoribosylformimino-5-aminoimidazole carboxamide ribotide isomerase
MRFRPCIDLHGGQVKQIVGSTLRDGHEDGTQSVETNFTAQLPPAYYAELYYRDGLEGGHVIMLGPGNEKAAAEALAVHPGNLQLGGGITPDNARRWLDAGAGKLIVTSYIFQDGELSEERLAALSRVVPREQLVLDLSCRWHEGAYHVACNRWQQVCTLQVNARCFQQLGRYCTEFLVHAVDVEGKQAGIDDQLLRLLAQDCQWPVTYAGGARSMADIAAIAEAGAGRIDVTVGSALDLFGGTGIRYADMVELDRRNRP